MARYVHFGVLTPADIGSRASGRTFLESLLEAVPEWAPDAYNDFEPVNRPFDPLKIEEALASWSSNFFWRKKRPSIHGSVWWGGGIHSSIYVKVPQRAFTVEPAVRLLRKLTQHFPVDLSYVHIAHDSDLDDREWYRVHAEPFMVGLTTHRLRAGLPNVPWAILFGPPYVSLFGREHLLQTPAAHVEETASGVYVQLTEDARDVHLRRDSYLASQRAAREHLNGGAFVGAMRSGELRVPEFLCPLQ